MRREKLDRMMFEHAEANPIPNSTHLQCPICGLVIHTTLPDDGRYPELIVAEAETHAYDHFANYHPWRFWLYRTTGWKRPVRGWFP